MLDGRQRIERMVFGPVCLMTTSNWCSFLDLQVLKLVGSRPRGSRQGMSRAKLPQLRQ